MSFFLGGVKKNEGQYRMLNSAGDAAISDSDRLLERSHSKASLLSTDSSSAVLPLTERKGENEVVVVNINSYIDEAEEGSDDTVYEATPEERIDHEPLLESNKECLNRSNSSLRNNFEKPRSARRSGRANNFKYVAAIDPTKIYSTARAHHLGGALNNGVSSGQSEEMHVSSSDTKQRNTCLYMWRHIKDHTEYIVAGTVLAQPTLAECIMTNPVNRQEKSVVVDLGVKLGFLLLLILVTLTRNKLKHSIRHSVCLNSVNKAIGLGLMLILIGSNLCLLLTSALALFTSVWFSASALSILMTLSTVALFNLNLMRRRHLLTVFGSQMVLDTVYSALLCQHRIGILITMTLVTFFHLVTTACAMHRVTKREEPFDISSECNVHDSRVFSIE